MAGRLFLQALDVGEGGHLSVERQDLQVGASVLVSDEAVEKAGAAGCFQGDDDRAPIQRCDQTAGKDAQQTRSSVSATKPIVVPNGHKCFPNHLVRSEDLGAIVFYQGDQRSFAALVFVRR